MTSTRSFGARNLAAAFLAGPWSREGLLERAARACGGRERWLASLVRRVLAAFADPGVRRDERALGAFLAADRAFARRVVQPVEVFWVAPVMAPAGDVPASWGVPPLPTPAALAGWLGLSLPELDWFADCQGREARVPAGPLRHYRYQWLARSPRKARLLEAPKPRLKALQRRLLHELLDRIPAHEAAHGYRRGRSIATYAAPHAGREIVLRFDLRDFFPSIRHARVHALFRTAGYPDAVARLLAGLCTNVAPPEELEGRPGAEPGDWPGRQRYRSAHLPQGAPTSPALANLCAYRLDCRLAGLARALGAGYTRYADDLAFSGGADLERGARRFQVMVCRVALEEGFEVHTRKSRFMRRGVRQQLAGVVVNVRPNVRRDEYERLEATLYNCVHHGPAGQNRSGHADFRAHLLGRIGHVALLHAGRGARLRDLFDRIDWGR